MAEKLPIEVMMTEVTGAMEEAFLIEPYLDGIAVVFTWKTGNTDMPFGLMLGRNGEITSPEVLLGLSGQTVKMLKHQAEQVGQMFEAADKLAGELASKIKKAIGESNV